MSFLEKIFSIKNSREFTHKVVTILGMKMKFKWKINPNVETNNFGISHTKQGLTILGNGPSLNDSLKDENIVNLLKKTDIMSVNFLCNQDNFFTLKPNYICFMDPAFWCDNPPEKKRAVFNKAVENISKCDWDIHLFLPKAAEEWNWFIDIPKSNEHVHLIYININDCDKSDDIRFLQYKTNVAMPSPQNVLVGSIYCAINMEYKNIYILGADHSWHLDLVVGDDNVLYVKDTHFYDKEEPKLKPIYKNPEGRDVATMRDVMRAYAIMYKNYEILEEYSKLMGSKIYNISKVSYIDAFERIKIGENNE